MTSVELLSAVRNILNDDNPPYKWPDSAVMRYLNEAEEQACKRAYLIIDRNTASICAMSVSVSVASYQLHSRVLQIRHLTLDSTTVPLTQVTREDMDRVNTGWVSVTGMPDGYIHEAGRELIFTRIPVSVDMARLIVARLPLNSFSTGSNESPEIDDEYHNDLIDWALKRAYEKRDPDTQDMKLSQFYEGRFIVRFGPLPNARTEKLRKSFGKNPSAYARPFGT